MASAVGQVSPSHPINQIGSPAQESRSEEVATESESLAGKRRDEGSEVDEEEEEDAA